MSVSAAKSGSRDRRRVSGFVLDYHICASALEFSSRDPCGHRLRVAAPLDTVLTVAVTGSMSQDSVDEVFVGLEFFLVCEGSVPAEIGHVKLLGDVVVLEIG